MQEKVEALTGRASESKQAYAHFASEVMFQNYVDTDRPHHDSMAAHCGGLTAPKYPLNHAWVHRQNALAQ